jgi:uridine kinase
MRHRTARARGRPAPGRAQRAVSVVWDDIAVHCLVVGIAGATGSGKTTVASRLAQAVAGRVATLQHDSYYRDRPELSYEQRSDLNFDHPDSLETELLVTHLSGLRRGETVEVPVYDFTTHRRAVETMRVAPAPVIIVEGILVLADSRLRELFDIKLFVDTDADIRVFRRIRRDIEQRGRTFDSVRQQYYNSVRPMTLEFVEPSKRFADMIIPEGGRNDVALDVLGTKLRTFADVR